MTSVQLFNRNPFDCFGQWVDCGDEDVAGELLFDFLQGAI